MVPLLNMEKMFEIYTILPLRGPSPGPHEYHLKTSTPLPLRMNSAKFHENPNMRFEEADEEVMFYNEPPSPTCYSSRAQ